MKRLSVLVAVGIVAILYSFSILRAQEYEIRLNRRYKAGDKYRLSVSGRQAEKMGALINNTPANQKAEEFSVELTASMEALEIDNLGRVTKFAMQMETCIGTVGGASKILFPAGTILSGTAENNRLVLTKDGAPLDPVTAKMIHLVMPSHTSGVTDDDVFGTRDKKRVGDTWSIQGDVAAKSFRDAFGMQAISEEP